MPATGTIIKRPASVDTLFKAFSDRTRLRILHILSSGETCVCDLMTVLELPQAKISRHLGYLRRAGLVRARKEGLWHYYTLAEGQTPFHRKLLECIECCLGEVPELKRDLVQLKRCGCREGCC